jgi:hypothetical protein
MLDAPNDFPSEEDVERTGPLPAANSPVAAAGGTPFDVSKDFPSERDAKNPVPSAGLSAGSRAARFPRPAPPGWQGHVAWWIAAGCAILAIAEAGIITGRIHLRSGNPSGITGADPSRSALGSGRPTPPQSVATVPSAALTATSSSQLEVTSDPPGARVSVDDLASGFTPVTLSVSPGSHAVIVSDGKTTSRTTVNAVAGGTATFLASFAPAAVAAGWVAIRSPLELQVREGESLLGMTSANRLMLPSGRHVLDLSNADAAFQTTLTVVVETGKTATSTVTIPNGSLSLNALPWASVTIDGQALPGTTPFANLQVPLGPHQIVWTHPQLGERRQTVLVTAKAPVRLVVDLRVK